MNDVYPDPGLDPPPVRPIHPAPGAQLPADEIIGRQGDVAKAFELLDRGSVLLNEPRRIGKTSLLTLLEAHPPPGWRCVRQSFQGVATSGEMVTMVLKAIAEHQSVADRVRGVARQFISSVEVSGGPISVRLNAAYEQNPSNALVTALSAINDGLDDDERLLFLWDEVPDMLHDVAAGESLQVARGLMAVLRRLRDEPSRGRIRWLMTGSVGFHHILKRMEGGTSLVNDMVALPLGPLNGAWSAWLCEGLLLGIGIAYQPTTVTAMDKTTGGIPYLAHLVAKQARDEGLDSLPSEEVEILFDRAVLDPDQGRPTTHQRTRLRPYYGEWTEAAEAILTELLNGPATRAELLALAGRVTPFPDDRGLREVLDGLCDDHYLVREVAGIYRWRHAPLARTWGLQTA